MMLAAVLAAVDAKAADGRPAGPLPTCTTVDSPARCQAVLTNTWDGRQVVHQLDPVTPCPVDRSAVLQDRVDRKNHTLKVVRAKVARLRERLAR